MDRKTKFVHLFSAGVAALLILLPEVLPFLNGHPTASRAVGLAMALLTKWDALKGVFSGVAVLALAATLGSCAKPDKFFEYIADCSVQECKAHCPELAGPVVSCLLSQNVTACLTSMIVPAKGITVDVIACVVRQLGSEANAAKLAGSADPQNAAVAAAAKKWIIEHRVGYR